MAARCDSDTVALGVSGIQTGADVAFPSLRHLTRPAIQNLDALPAALARRARGPVVSALAVRVAEEGADRTAGDLKAQPQSAPGLVPRARWFEAPRNAADVP
jgi:hypothetical protein